MANKTIKQLSTEHTTALADDWLVVQKDATSVTGKMRMSNVFDGGWKPLSVAPTTITALGNNSYTMLFPSVDYTGIISNGMRLRATRTVAAPNTAFSLDGSNDYYVKTSPNKLTFTDDFVCSAWVYLTSYTAGDIVSRFNGTSGFRFAVSNGQILLLGYNANIANVSYVQSYQSLPLNRWVHVAAQLDMSAFTATTTTSYVMIDGVDVPASVTRTGTNPTALVQAGNLEVGSYNGGTNPFPGYLDQVAVYSAKVTQATILASINRKLSGTETSLASAYSNGSVNDLNSTTPNNLTATNGATTVASSPFGNRGVSTTLEYGVVMANTFSTNTTVTVQVPEGCQLPTTGGISSVDYSTQDVPYGFPRAKRRWHIVTFLGTQLDITSTTTYENYNLNLRLPVGDWSIGYYGVMNTSKNATTFAEGRVALSDVTASFNLPDTKTRIYIGIGSSNWALNASTYVKTDYTATSATTLYMVGYNSSSAITTSLVGTLAYGNFKVFAENAYI